ncbi:MAG TPA: diacylglycerol kinase [Pararobbsia sp.]|jgi:diacylglycerol kinase (ATP)|nr:diacylglycerol kinase [Pararobbsia sp.]
MAEKDPDIAEREPNGSPRRERDDAVPHANGHAASSAPNPAQRHHAHDDPAARMAQDAPPLNPYKGNRGLTRAWYALKNSIQGFRDAWREESAFRQELTLAAILVPVSIVLPVTAVEHVLLVGSVLLVLIVELLNSSVEAAIDRISLDLHELSKRAKDFGSAAVTVALLLCLLTWILLAGPVVIHWFR